MTTDCYGFAGDRRQHRVVVSRVLSTSTATGVQNQPYLVKLPPGFLTTTGNVVRIFGYLNHSTSTGAINVRWGNIAQGANSGATIWTYTTGANSGIFNVIVRVVTPRVVFATGLFEIPTVGSTVNGGANTFTTVQLPSSFLTVDATGLPGLIAFAVEALPVDQPSYAGGRLYPADGS